MQHKNPVETLSPWWRHAVILVMVLGFTVLIWLAVRTYTDAPPIPEKVMSPSGETIFTREDILGGQQVFLRYGLMENGTIWGHGAYLGPDFSAEYLHAQVTDAGEMMANQRYGR
ncbi:MAG: nitric-oxide reductase large subunit, partial [Anaerolineae bacterium]